ncbi:MAG: type II toxin-antitoxin system RelE/ParE family toxin [Candidatus Micrarchaeales archaeon]|nr:type II toxin-antitoxin system RelE/ParE family toxin [Candidatus Micrarchaeales archaeon]
MPEPYKLDYRKHVDKILRKLEKKDKRQLLAIRNKIVEVLDNPQRFKPLNAPMQGLRRVHVMKSFVLTYSIDESTHTVWIEDYDHHDNIY